MCTFLQFGSNSSDNVKVGVLIEPLEDTTSTGPTTDCNDVNSVTKGLIDDLLERAVVEVKQEDLPDMHKELVPSESTKDLVQNNTEKATEVEVRTLK